MLSEDDVRVTAAGVADTLTSIDTGTLESTAVQRAFLAGSLDALQVVLDEPQARLTPSMPERNLRSP